MPASPSPRWPVSGSGTNPRPESLTRKDIPSRVRRNATSIRAAPLWRTAFWSASCITR